MQLGSTVEKIGRKLLKNYQEELMFNVFIDGKKFLTHH
jgi:hypothetical protein